MKPQTQFFIVVGILVLILGIAWVMFPGQRPEAAHVYAATIQQDCAPWDGAAFSVQIPLENGDVIEIAVWEAPLIQFGKTFSFPKESSQHGYASLVHSVEAREQLTGSVSFSGVMSGDPVEGRFELETMDFEQHFVGRFQAGWIDRIVLCG
jgi:hypothetical protein